MQLDDLLALLPHGETVDLDWKRTFPPGYFDGSTDQRAAAKGTLVKDVAAVANAASERVGHLVYGIADQDGQCVVHPVPRTEPVDEAMMRQFLAKYLDPIPTFEYAEFQHKGQLVGILRVQRAMPYPHVVRESLGGAIFKGQVYVRKGTLTEIALHSDLVQMIEGRRPMVLPTNDPQVEKLSIALQAEGWRVSWIMSDTLDQALLNGSEHVYFPGTRSHIETPSGNPYGMPQTMFLMRRRPSEGNA